MINRQEVSSKGTYSLPGGRSPLPCGLTPKQSLGYTNWQSDTNPLEWNRAPVAAASCGWQQNGIIFGEYSDRHPATADPSPEALSSTCLHVQRLQGQPKADSYRRQKPPRLRTTVVPPLCSFPSSATSALPNGSRTGCCASCCPAECDRTWTLHSLHSTRSSCFNRGRRVAFLCQFCVLA